MDEKKIKPSKAPLIGFLSVLTLGSIAIGGTYSYCAAQELQIKADNDEQIDESKKTFNTTISALSSVGIAYPDCHGSYPTNITLLNIDPALPVVTMTADAPWQTVVVALWQNRIIMEMGSMRKDSKLFFREYVQNYGQEKFMMSGAVRDCWYGYVWTLNWPAKQVQMTAACTLLDGIANTFYTRWDTMRSAILDLGAPSITYISANKAIVYGSSIMLPSISSDAGNGLRKTFSQLINPIPNV